MCILGSTGESEVHAEYRPPTIFLTSLTPSSFHGPDAAWWVQFVLPHRAGSLMGRARKNKGFILGLGSSPLPRVHCSCFLLRLPPELSLASDPRAQHSQVCVQLRYRPHLAPAPPVLARAPPLCLHPGLTLTVDGLPNSNQFIVWDQRRLKAQLPGLPRHTMSEHAFFWLSLHLPEPRSHCGLANCLQGCLCACLAPCTLLSPGLMRQVCSGVTELCPHQKLLAFLGPHHCPLLRGPNEGHKLWQTLLLGPLERGPGCALSWPLAQAHQDRWERMGGSLKKVFTLPISTPV